MEQEIKRGPGRPPKYHEQAVVQSKVAEMPSPTNSVAAEASMAVARPPHRKPFGALEQKLAYPAREGFHRHWFNDNLGRTARALEAGYEFVKGDDGKNVSRIVGTAEGGQALSAYLMEIPEEWWKADLAEQQKQVNDKEDTMRRGELEMAPGENRYVPAQGIKISNGR